MILFNLIFSQKMVVSSSFLRFNSTYEEKIINVSKPIFQKRLLLAYDINDVNILSKSVYDLADQKFLKSNVWSNIINSFWQQTLFLSLSNDLSNKYIAQLNSLNIMRNKANYKDLIYKFGKIFNNQDLSNTSFKSFQIQNTNKLQYIQYVWLKSFSIIQFNLFKANEVKYYFNNFLKIFDKNVSFNHLPLYTISNNLGQMIISEIPKRPNMKNHMFEPKLINTDNSNIYESWFFINFEDAQEYMQYITKYYNFSGKQNPLKIFPCNLKTFYKLSAKYSNKILLRLVPDLNQVGKLLYKYRYSNNIFFHKKQKYGSDYFQGQPIYMIVDKTKKNVNQDLYYNMNSGTTKCNYSLIFTNYNTALKIWKKMKAKLGNNKIYNKPKLVVYNLESFLKDQINTTPGNSYKLLLVPSENSYSYVKKEHLIKKHNKAYDNFTNLYSFFQLWTKRIFWSLTSCHPHYH